MNNGSLQHEKIERPPHQTKQISRQLGQQKYDEVFIVAIQMSDMPIVSCLCCHVDFAGIIVESPPFELRSGLLIT